MGGRCTHQLQFETERIYLQEGGSTRRDRSRNPINQHNWPIIGSHRVPTDAITQASTLLPELLHQGPTLPAEMMMQLWSDLISTHSKLQTLCRGRRSRRVGPRNTGVGTLQQFILTWWESNYVLAIRKTTNPFKSL